jgi:hypothetical protein
MRDPLADDVGAADQRRNQGFGGRQAQVCAATRQRLVDAYGRDNNKDVEKTENKSNSTKTNFRAASPTVATKLDSRPMGNQ